MPDHACRHGSQRPPGFCNTNHVVTYGPDLQSLDQSDTLLQGNIANRPQVGAIQCHQQVDIRCPWADALERAELLSDLVILLLFKVFKHNSVIEDGFGQQAAVTRFVSAETTGLEGGIIQFQKALWRKLVIDAAQGIELVEYRASRGQ